MTGYNPDQRPKCRLTQSAFRDETFVQQPAKRFRPCWNQPDWTQQTQQGKLDKRPGGEYIALVPRSGIFLSVIFVSDCSLIGFPWEHSRSEWGEAMNEPKGTGKSLSVILKFLAFGGITCEASGV